VNSLQFNFLFFPLFFSANFKDSPWSIVVLNQSFSSGSTLTPWFSTFAAELIDAMRGGDCEATDYPIAGVENLFIHCVLPFLFQFQTNYAERL
jgi:hypothetical protein